MSPDLVKRSAKLLGALWGMLRGPGLAGGLSVHLILGAVVVIALTGASQTNYRDAPSIVRLQVKKESLRSKTEPRSLPVVVRALEGSDPATRSVSTDDGLKAMQARMAVNILLRSGYIDRAVMVPDPSDPTAASYQVAGGGESAMCARIPVDSGDPSRHANLALAIVAAERFNRSSLQRGFEWALASLVERMTGRLPDFSLGTAQIRPSTIRRYEKSSSVAKIAKKIDGASLKQMLGDECQSLALASAVLYATKNELQSSKKCSSDFTCGQLAVLRYGGHLHSSEAVVDYLGLVWTMKTLLDSGIQDPPDIAPEDANAPDDAASSAQLP